MDRPPSVPIGDFRIMGSTPHELVPFAEAGRLFPFPASRATLHRWKTHGDGRGKKLKTILCGGRRFVDPAAVAEFLTPDDPGDDPAPAGLPTSPDMPSAPVQAEAVTRG
jgi:hypothetical protein